MNDITFKILDFDDEKSTNKLIDQIMIIEQNNLDYGWSENSWHSFKLGPKESFFLSYIIDQEVLGFCLFSIDKLDGHHELLKIVVDSGCHGSGHSKELFINSLHSIKNLYEYKDVYLDVAVSNTRAICFYKRLGFKEVRLVKKFYSDGVDAYGMLLSV